MNALKDEMTITQPDEIVRLGNSLIQHGPFNDRVYLMDLDYDDLPNIVNEIDLLGRKHGYTKLFAKVPGDATEPFSNAGYEAEAYVPGMYRNKKAGLFMCKYLDEARAAKENEPVKAKVLAEAQVVPQLCWDDVEDNGEVDRLLFGEARSLAQLYERVFETYPFPLHDPVYLQKAMQTKTAFFGFFSDDKLVAAASAEMDLEWQCAEMTDFATLPEYRGKGIATKLLMKMEYALQGLSIKTLFTIARAESFGMNKVFARCGYRFGGTLHNNTQIAGKLESMNVWHKPFVFR